MITKQILELVAQTPLNAKEIVDKLNGSKTVIFATLSSLSKRGLIGRDAVKKTEPGRGRKTIYIYRAKDATTQNGQGMDVGQQGTVPAQSASVASS
jgi:predicted transcriptional regulator